MGLERYYDYWIRIGNNVVENYLEITGITSLAKGKLKSLGKPFGVGKSSFALFISYVLHYWDRYGLQPIGGRKEDFQDRFIWLEVLKHMTYDKMELLDWASRRERIPALIWDDAQNTAPAFQHVPKVDKVIAGYLTTSRTSIANLIMTMPSVNHISKPFRDILNYELLVPERGSYEVQYIRVDKDFNNPEHDKKRLILLETGTFVKPPDWVYKQYLEWRESERRRVLMKYAKDKGLKELQGVLITL